MPLFHFNKIITSSVNVKFGQQGVSIIFYKLKRIIVLEENSLTSSLNKYRHLENNKIYFGNSKVCAIFYQKVLKLIFTLNEELRNKSYYDLISFGV